MGFFSWLRGKRSKPESEVASSANFAFVLLSESQLPRPEDVVAHFESFGVSGEILEDESDPAKREDERQVLSLRLSTGETCFVALLPAAVPNGEADQAADFSLSAFRDGWKLPPHGAHLIVMFQAVSPIAPLVGLSRFTSVLAAVARASSAVGIYWGNAGATHDPEFFMSLASEQDVVPKMMLWTGVSRAHERDGRFSLLSLGMTQLFLPNLLLVTGPLSKDSALATMFDLLAYVAQRGKPIPEGETVGMTAEQRLPVRYVASPLDSKVKVWRVELP